MTHKCMKVGDVAVPTYAAAMDGKILHCATMRYSHAIVGSIDPFVLVSSTGDMVWSCTWEPHELEFLCQASNEIKAIVAKRMKSDKESR